MDPEEYNFPENVNNTREQFTNWDSDGQPYPDSKELREKLGVRLHVPEIELKFKRYPLGRTRPDRTFRLKGYTPPGFNSPSEGFVDKLSHYLSNQPTSPLAGELVNNMSLDSVFKRMLDRESSTEFHQNLEYSGRVVREFLHDIVPTFHDNSTVDSLKAVDYAYDFIRKLGRNVRKIKLKPPINKQSINRVIGKALLKKNTKLDSFYHNYLKKYNITQTEFERWTSNNTLSRRLKQRGISLGSIRKEILDSPDTNTGRYFYTKYQKVKPQSGLSSKEISERQAFHNPSKLQEVVRKTINIEQPTNRHSFSNVSKEPIEEVIHNSHISLNIKDSSINYMEIDKKLAKLL